MDTPATPLDQLEPTLARLRRAQATRVPDYAQRQRDLSALRKALRGRLEAMVEAIHADFGLRSRHESLLTDGMTVLSAIDDLRVHLRGWMRPQRRPVGWRFWPGRAEVQVQPLGVVGVIAPWNYPVNLALIPLVTAIAAGNHVMLKPSEHTPHTALFLRELLASVFPDDRVATVLGGPDVAQAFSALPFDHLLFTGSTAVGRKVMAAAAQNLTPVTLELGGKSPALLGRDYPLARAAARIATGKWLNAGQTCIAPDYVLAPRERCQALVAALRREVSRRYPELAGNSDYTRIINPAQYRRLRGWLEEARGRGARIVELVDSPPGADLGCVIAPTVVLDAPADCALMREEIFGPVLPVVGYTTLDDALEYINARGRPLALYHFEHNRRFVGKVLAHTVSGGVTVNDTLLHNGVDALPFGGVGASGMGHYHGREGFLAFSKLKSVFYQARWSAVDLLRPPYRGLPDFIVRRIVR
ncbi:MAG TPA: coniferyl aldehyde dehydrogenase [Xanthomonadaceae bacterium]|nr:coniferyl aldehyde dehydrogenase [Xanthomonadaceae bacterium]